MTPWEEPTHDTSENKGKYGTDNDTHDDSQASAGQQIYGSAQVRVFSEIPDEEQGGKGFATDSGNWPQGSHIEGDEPPEYQTVDKQKSNEHHFSSKLAAIGIGLFQILLTILFAASSSYIDMMAPANFTSAYNMFLGVEIMMFIGFGYLMVFLMQYMVGALGLTMLITVLAMQWGLLTERFFEQVYHWDFVNFGFTMQNMTQSLYAVGAVLISFGGVIGKVSPLQLLVMMIIEVVFYSINGQLLMIGEFKLVDIGGTIVIHMFGAYFGLAVAYILGPPNNPARESYIPSTFTFIGTLFLWVYWPSFVGAIVAEAGEMQQQRAVINTIFALASSTTMAFCVSPLLQEDAKMRPADIQNATLAGGVAIGAVANLSLSPVTSSIIGIIAGVVSTLGFSKLQPLIEDKLKLHDTCGINNLHGMPSIIGAIASVVIIAYQESKNKDEQFFGKTCVFLSFLYPVGGKYYLCKNQ